MPLRAVLIDDEQPSIDNLVAIFNEFFKDVEVIGIANNGADGKQLIKKLQPDVVFLDVEMPGMDGLDLLRSFDNIQFEVVFVSAFQQYAVQAFRLAAIDFLLKPVDLDELEQCLERIRNKQVAEQRLKSLKTFIDNYSPGSQSRKIPLATADRLHFVKVNSIIRCEGSSNYSIFYLGSGQKIVVSKTLKEYENSLKKYDFLRVHQSHLVNKEHIVNLVKSDGGYLHMADGFDVPIARSRKEFVINTLRDF